MMMTFHAHSLPSPQAVCLGECAQAKSLHFLLLDKLYLIFSSQEHTYMFESSLPSGSSHGHIYAFPSAIRGTLFFSISAKFFSSLPLFSVEMISEEKAFLSFKKHRWLIFSCRRLGICIRGPIHLLFWLPASLSLFLDVLP